MYSTSEKILWHHFELESFYKFGYLICYIVTCTDFQLMAEERGLVVDVEGFNKAMDEARDRARAARIKVFD